MDFPNIAGPYGSIKDGAMFKIVKKHLNTLEDDLDASEVEVLALQTYLITGPRVVQPAAITIASNAENVLMNQPLIILVAGELITVQAAEIDISGLAATPVAVTTTKVYRCLLTAAVADGTINFVEGDSVASGETAVTPDAATGTIGFGYVEITTAATTTFGTTALTTIATFKDLITSL